jgi:DNA-binding protein YbaB
VPDAGAGGPVAGSAGSSAEREFAKRMRAAGQSLAQAREALDDITGEGSAADDMIQVVTDGGGGLTSLTLSPRIRRLDSETLAEELTKAIQQAQADAKRKAREATVAAVGDDAWAQAQDPDRFGEQLHQIQETLARSLEGHLSVIEGKLNADKWQ